MQECPFPFSELLTQTSSMYVLGTYLIYLGSIQLLTSLLNLVITKVLKVLRLQSQ